MRESLKEIVKSYGSRKKAKKAFRKFCQVLGCAVAFVTTYALILPAITMEKTTFCGLEEHTHVESCYQQQIEQREFICNQGTGLHVHSNECYHENGSVICGQADYLIHSHDASCRNASGDLMCKLPERSQHVHTDNCYVTPEPVPHVHKDDCMADVKGDLICTQQVSAGHSHSYACYRAGEELLCTKVEGHQHNENCYAPKLNCTVSTAPHSHDSDCYAVGELICNVPVNHIHQGDCVQTTLVCGQAENTHTHEPGCYTSYQICTEDHEHTESCWQQTLSCGVSTHTHTDSCYEEKTICTIQEGHSHGFSCYERNLTCRKAEGEVHVHTDSCYGAPQLNCSMETDHVHGDSCYTQELNCDIAESEGHAHDDSCYQWNREYVCGLEEGQMEEQEPQLVCTEPAAASHTHGADCFEIKLIEAEPVCTESHDHTFRCYQQICIMKEHEHSAQCYSDPEADVETRQYWEATMRNVVLTDDWNANVVAIAESQLGYTESTRNYTVWEDGSRHGYTRYGAWYGVPHGDWCGMFASFCLEYAGVKGMPYNYGVRPWIEQLTKLNLYRTSEEYVPIPGDLVFFDWEQDGLSDHVGVVYEILNDENGQPVKLKTIEGNSSNCVQFRTYDLDDPVLLGYSMLPEKRDVPVYHCGMEVHEHGESCFDAEGNSVCQLPEHQHEDSCQTEPDAEPVYYCGMEVHEHGESCFDAEGNSVCQLPEHRHEDSCLTEPYYCGMEAHKHGESCFDADGNSICQLPEHQHEESCRKNPKKPGEYFCELTEHMHGEDCFAEDGKLTCQLQEHAHSDDCLKPKVVLKQASITAEIYTDSTYSVLSEDTMQIVVEGMLPEEAKIRAYPITLDTQQQVLCAYEIEILQQDGTVFEPAEGEILNVTFESSFLEEQEDMQVYYIPEEGEPEAVDTTITEEGIAFEAPHFSVYAVMTTAAEMLEPFDNGTISYAWNTVPDAFIYDPQYASFYNASSPLGTAGSFHIVGFDTVTLNSHTNGNILAHTLIAVNNFGTNSKNNVDLIEISYAQNYQHVNSNSSADTSDYLVVGSDNTVGLTNNGHSLAVNGVKMDKPYHIVQDVSTAEAPFINLARVESEINAISSNLAAYNTSAVSVLKAVTSGSNPYLELVSADNVGVYNITSSKLMEIKGDDGWDMRGFVSGANGAIVINVDCANADRATALEVPKSRVYVDGSKVPLEETLDFSAGKVIWNFVNASGLTIKTTELTGMVIAPGATVTIEANLNGTVVAENVNVNAESHRTDFAGRVIPTEHIDGAHIHVYKVDKNNYGTFLQGAKFTLYEWNGASWVVAQQNSQNQIDITDAEGKVIFQKLNYNTAYRLEETQAPPGYKISTDDQYYYFPHPDTGKYPVRKPANFTESNPEDCIIHYYPNEESDVEVTSLHLEKKWQDQQGNDLTVTPWDSVQVEITKGVSHAVLDSAGNVTYDADGQIIYEDAVAISVLDTVTVYASDGWMKTLSNLPVTSEDRKEKYTYSAREIGTDDVLSPDENGIVNIINQAEVTYVPLALEKDWEEEPPEDVSEITFHLFRMYRRGDEETWSEPELILDDIVLNAGNQWRWEAQEHTVIKEMSYGDDTVSFAYFAVETPVPEGYYPDYHEISQQTPLMPETQQKILKVSNKKIQYMNLQIIKQWQDINGNPMTEVSEESVTVQLMQSADDGLSWIEYGTAFEIEKQNGWKYYVGDLPLENEQGQKLSYRMEEQPIQGYISSGGEVGEDGSVIIVNRQIQTTSLQIRKLWKEADGSILKLPPVDQIQIQLLQSVNNGSWQPYQEPVTLKAEDGWELTVEGLPLADPILDKTYQYSVQELQISDLYESTVSEVADGVITVTNTRKIEATDIVVEKHWFDRTGKEFYANSGSVEVQLFQLLQSSGGNGGSSGSMVNVTVNVGRWWSDGSFWNRTYTVPSGTKFTIQYSVAGLDYKLALDDLNNPSAILTPISVVPNGTESVVTYEYVATQSCSLMGKLGYYQGGSMDVSYSSGIPVGTGRLGVTNDWRYLFSDLPCYAYDEAGNITGSYYYFVEEIGGAQYNATYWDVTGNRVSADHPVVEGTITVCNTLPENSYTLPETGGSGSTMYTGVGLLMMAVSGLLLLHRIKRRREDVLHQ